jgi:predicted transposase/invertase (TIGR01784 family)
MPGLLEALDWSMVRGIDDRKRAEKLSELGYEVDREMESELIGMNSIEADRERRARREGIAEGVSKGRAEGKIETASRMLADGMPEDKVRQYTGLTEEQIEEARRLLRIP